MNSYLSFGITSLATSALLAGCAMAMPPDPIPNDGKDDLAAIQAQIDHLALLGGGTVQLELGRYDISNPIVMKTGVALIGRGNGTLISNEALNNEESWFGTVVLGGTMSPSMWAENAGRGYQGTRATRVANKVVDLPDCGNWTLPTVDEVVWLYSSAGEEQKRDNFRPFFGEINRVVSIEGCQITLEDELSIPSDEELMFNRSDGSKSNPGVAPNMTVADVTVSDMRLRSKAGQALRVTGCYKCTFENLDFERTRRFLMVQGMRHGIYRDISGNFSERGLELTMFTWDNLIENIEGKFEYEGPPPNGEIRPAIRFGEFARGNTLRNVTLELGEEYAKKIKLRFDPGDQNSLSNVLIVSPGFDDNRSLITKAHGQRARAFGTLPSGTMLNDVRVCDDRQEEYCSRLTN